MRKKLISYISFSVSMLIIIVLFIAAIVKTNMYNSKNHVLELAGADLFTVEPEERDVSVNITARGSTWGKIFDFNNEGITENNYTAHTYDFFIDNNTKYDVKKFSFKFVFSYDAYITSAWNGAIEFHQFNDGNEIINTIPDLRDYNAMEYSINKRIVDGETLVVMKKGDFLIYHPSESMNALEMPIKPHEGTTPGMILYTENGHSIDGSSLILNYTFYKHYTSEPLFWVSISGFGVWAIVFIIVLITFLQVRKYKILHERDYKIINESIETFTGFIDAKDPYTNGHSKRVAIYTKLLAKELGFEGEELDDIYYIALLHDSGKIGIPDNILGKPGKLTDEEFEIIKSHTVVGGEILSNFKSLPNAGEGALYHHERYDGTGYPRGLAGKEIPLIARIICVADSFDAMNSSRVYRKKLSYEYIMNELENNKGTQFDPEIAEIMINLIKEGKVYVEK